MKLHSGTEAPQTVPPSRAGVTSGREHYGFINTTMHWRVNHGVGPKSQALSCTHCHSPDRVMDFKALGYSGDPALSKGR
ncbi:MAG: hypothetical protein ACLFUT_13035 [Desulfobacteraceae bacterium]